MAYIVIRHISMTYNLNPDYSRTVIYKIMCKDPEVTDIYIGATTGFKTRRRCHQARCANLECTAYLYRYIREHGEWDSWDMVTIENYPCANKQESNLREKHWIKTLAPALNLLVPLRAVSKEQYRIDNKAVLLQQHIQYNNDNRELIREKSRIYCKANKDAIAARHQEKNKVKHTCECGSVYTYSTKTAHIRSKKHAKYCESVENIQEESDEESGEEIAEDTAKA